MITFGPFTLMTNERLLIRDGVPVELGARAFDILAFLAARPNEIVSKRDLLAHAWPDVTVEDGSLRFHVANLRRALGDGKDGARYITTLMGRGYCFVAPVSHSPGSREAPAEVAVAYPQANLPSSPMRMIGRRDEVREIVSTLTAVRFLTIVGMGGVGKTTVSLAVGHDLVETFSGAVHFVDLGALNDASLLAATVASTLGLSIQSDDAAAALLSYLRDKQVLLIFDTCEHVIDAAAGLAARIVAAAPRACLLATSREALQAEGEHVYKLAPLACAPDDPDMTAPIVQSFPAIRLFVERAAASGVRLDLDDADAAVVAGICRKLDGVPLAIELAAGRVGSYGLRQTAALLDHRLTLLWPGRRTAPPRQKTLQATLDWSHGLLTGVERRLLRRLAVFVGDFSVEAAVRVVTDTGFDDADVFGAMDSLIAKSMIAARPIGATMRYRLLDTTRAYALQNAPDEAERRNLSARHADHYLRWVQETGAEWPTLSSAAQRSHHLAGLANVRAALGWCFGSDGDAELGIRLASAAAPALLSMSLLTECHRWTYRALQALGHATRGSPEEMRLQAALGVSLMFTRGGSEAARVALDRSLVLADGCGDALAQLQILGPLQMFHLRTGAFRNALYYAERCALLADTLEDPVSATLAHALMGISLHLTGELERARNALETALLYGPHTDRTTTNYLGFDGRVLAGAILARTLWLQGHPDKAVERAMMTIEEAEGLGQPLTLSIALVWAVSVFLWVGDLDIAARKIDRLIACAQPHALTPYIAVGRGFQGELAFRQGDAHGGIDGLQLSLSELHAAPYELLTTPLNLALVQALAATGRSEAARSLIDGTIRQVETGGDFCYMPELLRLKGGLALADDDAGAAEAHFRRSLEHSRAQGARAWELRTAIDLASLLAARGEYGNAHALLHPVVDGFAEDLNATELTSAATLLAILARSADPHVSSRERRPPRGSPRS